MASADDRGYALANGTAELYERSLFSDLTIRCGEKEFKVHKSVFYPQSKYFRKLLAGDFKEGLTQQSYLELDDDPAIFAMLVHYMYYFTYAETMRPDDMPPSIFAVLVYAIADKYHVPDLCTMAVNRSKRLCVIVLTQRPEVFVNTLYTINDNTADFTLWDIVIPLIKEQIHFLLNHPTAGFKQAVKDIDELNFRLSEMLDEHQPKSKLELESDDERPIKRVRRAPAKPEEERDDSEIEEVKASKTVRGKGRFGH